MFHSSGGGNGVRAGNGDVPRAHIAEIQRSRMLDAALEAIDEVGYAHLTVAQVISRARVSRKTFYDVFADREDCFVAIFDEAVERARRVAAEAFETGDCWRSGMRAAVAALLEMADEEPQLARLCVVESLAAGDAVLERRARVLAQAAAGIDLARGAPGAEDPPAATAEFLVGGALAILHGRMRDRSSGPVSGFQGELMSMIVLPYLGQDAAAAELRDACAQHEGRGRAGARPRRDPLQGLNMRLTYRTMRVLEVVASKPGASNREIAQVAGISDQGQISKLLGRLARLDLVENLGEGQPQGARNAWRLTSRGRMVESIGHPR